MLYLFIWSFISCWSGEWSTSLSSNFCWKCQPVFFFVILYVYCAYSDSHCLGLSFSTCCINMPSWLSISSRTSVWSIVILYYPALEWNYITLYILITIKLQKYHNQFSSSHPLHLLILVKYRCNFLLLFWNCYRANPTPLRGDSDPTVRRLFI